MPLYVALQRGIKLEDIDFICGGSTLDILANRKIEKRNGDDLKYLVQKLPYKSSWKEGVDDVEEAGTGGRTVGTREAKLFG